MRLYIENKVSKLVYIYLLGNNSHTRRIIKNEMDIDLNKYKFCYFKDEDNNKTERIILSNNLKGICLDFNLKTNKFDAYLFVKNANYNKVKTVTLYDEKNLAFREDKKKNIHILLPNDYISNKKYGVLLMFDSQNIFDLNKVGHYTDKNDPYGGWNVESSIYSYEYIVVGIENSDEYREKELTPSLKSVEFKDVLYKLNDDGLLKGELDYFRKFINETLFPYLINNYNIDLNNLGICGSSCGGLASFYIGLKDYNKYKFVFTFTPATGFIKDASLEKIYKEIDFKKNKESLPYIFYYQGKKGELEKLLFNVNKNLINNLVKNGYPNDLIDKYIENSADHNETVWRYAFNYAIIKYMEYKENKDGSK